MSDTQLLARALTKATLLAGQASGEAGAMASSPEAEAALRQVANSAGVLAGTIGGELQTRADSSHD